MKIYTVTYDDIIRGAKVSKYTFTRYDGKKITLPAIIIGNIERGYPYYLVDVFSDKVKFNDTIYNGVFHFSMFKGVSYSLEVLEESDDTDIIVVIIPKAEENTDIYINFRFFVAANSYEEDKTKRSCSEHMVLVLSNNESFSLEKKVYKNNIDEDILFTETVNFVNRNGSLIKSVSSKEL